MASAAVSHGDNAAAVTQQQAGSGATPGHGGSVHHQWCGHGRWHSSDRAVAQRRVIVMEGTTAAQWRQSTSSTSTGVSSCGRHCGCNGGAAWWKYGGGGEAATTQGGSGGGTVATAQGRRHKGNVGCEQRQRRGGADRPFRPWCRLGDSASSGNFAATTLGCGASGTTLERYHQCREWVCLLVMTTGWAWSPGGVAELVVWSRHDSGAWLGCMAGV